MTDCTVPSLSVAVQETVIRLACPCFSSPVTEARATADRLIEGVTTVGYDGFVDLVANHRNCQSWL